MSAFKKAEPKQAFLKISAYGPQGSGKTFTSLLFAEGLAKAAGKRVAYVDTERGTDFYAMDIDDRKMHPEAFDFDAIYTRSLAETLEAVKGIDPNEHGVIVIDSISHMWDAAIEAYQGKMVGKDQSKIPMQAWASIKRPYKQLIQQLLDAPIHVIICGRQKNIFEDDGDSMKKVGVGLRAEGETQYEPHICLRMEPPRPNDESGTILMIAEKDRSGILMGSCIPNPSFETIRPILPYLGVEQATSADPDDVADRDAELMDESERAAKKRAASDDIYADLNNKIAQAESLNALADVAAEIKKAKRKLVPEHLEALRLVYNKRNRALSEQQAPSEV